MKITARTNGPLLVEGQIEVVDQNGRVYKSKNAAKFALCRCGGSSTKPFCDGTHVKIAFRSPPQPVEENVGTESALANWETEGGSVRAPAVRSEGSRPAG